MPGGWTASSIIPAISRGSAVSPGTTLRPPAPDAGRRDVAAQSSVYQRSDVPEYLTSAISNLNAEQSLRRSLQSEWNDRLLKSASQGGPNSFLFQEALRAASVSPGAHVAFGSAVQNPAIGNAAMMRASSEAAQAHATAEALSAPAQIASQLAKLHTKRAQLPSGGFGFTTPEQMALDAKIQNLQSQLPGAVQIASGSMNRPKAAAPASSGWVSGAVTQPRNTSPFLGAPVY